MKTILVMSQVCFVASERTEEPHSEVVARLQQRLEREKAATTFVPRAKEIQVSSR